MYRSLEYETIFTQRLSVYALHRQHFGRLPSVEKQLCFAPEMEPDAKPGEEPARIVVDEASSADGDPVASSSSTLPSSTANLTPEEQKEWVEARIRRRLASEYERAGRALSEVVRAYLIWCVGS